MPRLATATTFKLTSLYAWNTSLVYSIAWVIFPLFTTGYKPSFDNPQLPTISPSTKSLKITCPEHLHFPMHALFLPLYKLNKQVRHFCVFTIPPYTSPSAQNVHTCLLSQYDGTSSISAVPLSSCRNSRKEQRGQKMYGLKNCAKSKILRFLLCKKLQCFSCLCEGVSVAYVNAFTCKCVQFSV